MSSSTFIFLFILFLAAVFFNVRKHQFCPNYKINTKVWPIQFFPPALDEQAKKNSSVLDSGKNSTFQSQQAMREQKILVYILGLDIMILVVATRVCFLFFYTIYPE